MVFNFYRNRRLTVSDREDSGKPEGLSNYLFLGFSFYALF